MLIGNKDFFLIDVREPEEYEEGHIEKSILMPLNTVVERMKGIRKDKPLVLYCRTGRRSKSACENLKEAGFTDVKHLEGDMRRGLMEVRS